MRVARAELVDDAPGLSRRGCLVVLEDGSGTVGIGEASPLPGFSDETWTETRRALVGAVRQLVAADLGDGEVAAVTRDVLKALGATCMPASARFAVETALVDLLARRGGVPLHGALGARAGGPLTVSAMIRLDARPASEIVLEARSQWSAGVATVKLKTGARDDRSFERDLDAIAAVRAALPELGLRVDPNGAWTLEQAKRRLAALGPLGIEYVEQPVPARELRALDEADVAWAADESLRLEGEPERLLERGACSVFVLKPQLHGGLLAARELARRAADSGVDSVVTHAFEGSVGLAACAELSLVLAPRRACGLEPSYLPEGAPVPPQLRHPGRLEASERPGHGLERP